MTTEAKDKTDNEIIAEFMAVRKGPFGGLQYPQFRYIETSSGWCDEPSHYEYKTEYKPNQLKYHESWAWLMPVVEKIESLKFSFMIVGGYSRINKPHPFKEFSTNICATKIESVYTAVVDFIRWYNANQPKP